MKVSELLSSEISAINGLTPEGMVGFVHSQIGGIRANLPWILAVSLAGMVSATQLAPHDGKLLLWVVFGLFALLTALIILPRTSHVTSPADIAKALRRIEASAFLIAVCWAALPVSAASLPQAASFATWLAVLIVSSIVAYCMAAVPSAALLLTGLTATTLSLPGLVTQPEWQSLILFLTGMCYFAVFSLLIVAQYRSQLDLARNDENYRRQGEIVSLLLKDFESGSKDWLWETNAQGELVYLSDRLAELLGCRTEQLLGKRLNEISSVPGHIRPWQLLHQAMSEQRDVRAMEVPVKLARKTYWWQITARPVFAADGEFLGYRGIGRDVTEPHKAKADLLQAKETAERASQAKSQFLNVMSHELRTPLNALIGFSEILAEEREGPLGARSYRDYARSILESSRQLQRIISDILDASRIDAGTFKLLEQEVDVSELAQVALSNCRQLAAHKNVSLSGDYRSIRAEIRGDLLRLKQILDNLLINAIKFTPPSGLVELKVSDEPDGGLSFVIRDTGIGIDKNDLERVFEPFVQADVGMSRQYGGTGLGLPIARKLARVHGGDITLESSPKKGTTATFRLPPDRIIRAPASQPIAEGSAAA
jgi:PAS domain S-box-containing protein